MPVNIRGKSYATVAERLGEAHGNDGRPTGITSVFTAFMQVSDHLICQATITFGNGTCYQGTAEVTRGSGGGPQATSPVETAETSAVGRALAMAGWFGSGDGIAGAEEVRVAEARARRVEAEAARIVPGPRVMSVAIPTRREN